MTEDKKSATPPEQTIIEASKDFPFVIGEDKHQQKAAKFVVAPIGFIAFTDCSARAARRATEGQYKKVMFRERLAAQVKVFDSKGKLLVPRDEEWQRLPRIYVTPLSDAIEIERGVRGSVVVDGDGVTTPLVYKFGTPLELGGSGQGEGIAELEFMARTLGDIEDVIAEESKLSQTVALIRTCGKPVATGDVKLLTLPEWAVDQITVPDGVAIMQGVLPRFL